MARAREGKSDPVSTSRLSYNTGKGCCIFYTTPRTVPTGSSSTNQGEKAKEEPNQNKKDGDTK